MQIQEATARKIVDMDEGAVRLAYKRWAPVYDLTFGLIADAGRMRAVEHINRLSGHVLEVGVGTGMSLTRYRPHLKVSGIDLSPEMLERARERVERRRLQNVEAILEMDASAMRFADNSFDVVVAMFVLTVVPDPARVMAELERVCRPGGEVIVVNHFSQEHGVRGAVEKGMARFAETLGFRSEFPVETLLGNAGLRLIDAESLKPLGLFSMLRFTKQPAGPESNARALKLARRAGLRTGAEIRDATA
jgi:phosphatidylethanolamine/phosphatidyl-N-methylethanolamine N-methyltransferase